MSYMDDDDIPEVDGKVREALHEKAEQIEAAAHKIGLHAQSIGLATAVDPSSGESGTPVLIATFAIGNLAFTDRVQDPERDAVDDEIAKIEHDLTLDKLQELRERMMRTDDGETPDSRTA